MKESKHKIVIGCEVLLLCMMIGVLGTKAASANPPSNGVSYSKNSQTTVEGALNDLYNKANQGNASAAQILKGKTALVGGKQVTGTMVDRGAVSTNLSEGGTYTIPAGYHNGSGKVTCAGSTTTKPTIPDTPSTTVASLKIGDYINYKPSSTSYTVSASETAFSSAQTINPSELTVWRVIRKNNNGTVEIVSEDVSSTVISFGNSKEVAYRNCIGTLNKIAEAYENSTYTVGSRHMGYDGTAEEYLTTSISSGGDRGYMEDKSLVESAVGHLKARSVDRTLSGFDSYWLASRAYPLNATSTSGSSRDYYFINLITSEGELSNHLSGLGTNLSLSAYAHGRVRPIVILKSTLKLTGGNGTSNSPYTLGV